jgi:hypothetical protein
MADFAKATPLTQSRSRPFAWSPALMFAVTRNTAIFSQIGYLEALAEDGDIFHLFDFGPMTRRQIGTATKRIRLRKWDYNDRAS